LRNQNSVEPILERSGRRAGERIAADDEDRKETQEGDKWQRLVSEQAKLSGERIREPG
jgi:hypothetical protein